MNESVPQTRAAFQRVMLRAGGVHLYPDADTARPDWIPPTRPLCGARGTVISATFGVTVTPEVAGCCAACTTAADRG